MSNETRSSRADQAPSEKKVWRHTFIAASPNNERRFLSIQELVGAHVWSDKEQKVVFEYAEEPVATRVVLMEIDENGFARNVNSGPYNGNKIY